MNATRVPRPSAAIEDRQVGLQTNYANRELLLSEGLGGDPISVPNIPLLSIRGWLCVRCLAHNPDLKACSACKRVRHCSERCQKVDWKYLRKHHCKAFRQINLGVDQNAGPQSWGPFCDWLVRYLQQEKERGLAGMANVFCKRMKRLTSQSSSEYPYERTSRTCRQYRVVDLWLPAILQHVLPLRISAQGSPRDDAGSLRELSRCLQVPEVSSVEPLRLNMQVLPAIFERGAFLYRPVQRDWRCHEPVTSPGSKHGVYRIGIAERVVRLLHEAAWQARNQGIY